MTNEQLAEKLKTLANHMIDVADEMLHHDSGDSVCDDLIIQHATELEGASEMCREWAEEITKIQVSK